MTPLTTMERLQLLKIVVDRCRAEGRAAAIEGKEKSANPYAKQEDLEFASWLAGWSLAKSSKES